MVNFFDATPTPEEEPILFNAEALDDTDECVLCRDRDEVSILLSAGVVGAVTVTGGKKWLTVLSDNTDRLNRMRKITIAVPDGQLREEIVRRLGRHRCYTIDRPVREIDDETNGDGLSVLKAVLEAAPYPIKGLQKLVKGNLRTLRRQPPPETMSTGTQSTDDKLKLPTEGRLIVITGIPSHGKTSWTRFAMVHTAAKHNRRWCVFSPESQPWQEFIAQCAEAYMGKPFWPVVSKVTGKRVESMTDAEIDEAEAFLSNRVTMLVCDAEGEPPTLEWLLERARACVLRDGTTDFLIDPWNEVDQQRGEMNETDWIGLCLQRLKAFAFRHGCNVWIIAHPSKPPPTRANEKAAVPGAYSINGSSHWANKTDLGMTIHSPKAGMAELHIWKVRSRRWGVRGQIASMDYDQLVGTYSTPVKKAGDKEEPVADLLQGEWGV